MTAVETSLPRFVLVSHHLCPYVQRAVIALLEKNVGFDRVNVDLANKPAWFTDISPLGKTPLLRVGDEVLFESSVICEYLEDVTPHPLHPHDPLTRAKHRAWMEFGSTLIGDIFAMQVATEESVFTRKRDDAVVKFRRVETILGNGPYFAGVDFCLVDAVFAPVFRYFDTFDTLLDMGMFHGLPAVTAWRSALHARPSVRDAVGVDYSDRLRAFLTAKNAYILRAAH